MPDLPVFDRYSPWHNSSPSFESLNEGTRNVEWTSGVDKELPPIPNPIPRQLDIVESHPRATSSLRPLEATCQVSRAERSYGSVVNIAKAENIFSGTNFGTVIQNSGHEPSWLDSLLQRLKIAQKADYAYYPGGREAGLRRGGCTPGTRVEIVGGVVDWATDGSPKAQSVFWLSGQAGAGKTAIAYTMSRLFERLIIRDSGCAELGGSFFCSRHSPETRDASAVVRTIAYRLAVRSGAFRQALMEFGRFDTVDHGPKAQLEGLLIEPWKQSAPGRLAAHEPCYIVSIDALDELDGEGGLELLGALFDAVSMHDLTGIKFLVTSRLEPALVKQIELFDNKQVCRLEQVPIEESSADIKLFLIEHLGDCASKEQIQLLVEDAAGLFIYAATVVEYVKGRDHGEKQSLLKRLLTLTHSRRRHHSRAATSKLDDLYLDILETSLVDQRDQTNPQLFNNCLSILHTFLCTLEPTSPVVVVDLLNGIKSNTYEYIDVGVAQGVLHRLHAVLYREDGNVMWFHKSFPDFIFDKKRSRRFYCDQGQQHRQLLEGCFDTMKWRLHFNIAGISSSCKLDRDDEWLSTSVANNISPSLRYACHFWSGHLNMTPFSPFSPILGIINEFLQIGVLFWLEAMNLLKQRGRCESLLREAYRRVTQLKGPEWLANDLAFAAAFALHFSGNGAAASTPHLYLSSLSTFPRPSNLSQVWRQHFTGIPKFTNAHGAASQELNLSFMVGSGVGALAVSSNDTTIVSGSEDGLVRVWNMGTGEEIKVLIGHTAEVTSVAYSSDNSRLVSGSADYSARVWDLSTGKELATLNTHINEVTSVAFSPITGSVASASKDQSVRTWEPSTRQECVFRGHTGAVTVVRYSPDGTKLVSGSHDGTVRLWNVHTGEALGILGASMGKVAAVAFSPDGSRVVSGSYNRSLQVWNLLTGEEFKIPDAHSNWVTSVAYSPDGTRIVSGSYDESVRTWDQSTGEELAVLHGHSRGITAVAYSPHGSHVVSSSYDQSIRIWDVSLDKRTKKEDEGHNGEITSVEYSSDGTHILSGSGDHTARLWDAFTGKELRAFKGPNSKVNSVAYSSSGTCATSNSNDEFIRIWDANTGKKLKVLRGHIKGVTALAFAPHGTRIVSGSHDHSVRVWNISTGKQLELFVGHRDWITSVAHSPLAPQIASGSNDNSVRVWGLLGKKVLENVLRGHTDTVTSVTYSRDGRHLASGSHDHTIRVWNPITGDQLRVLRGHSEEVSSVAFSPGGAHVASGSWDRSVRVWDLSTSKQLKILRGHTAEVTSVAYSPDGSRVVSASKDKSIRIWAPYEKESQVRYLRERASGEEYTGWLVSPTNPSEYLMFVPLAENLPDDSNILTIPSSLAPIIDFSSAKVGLQWTECYTPVEIA